MIDIHPYLKYQNIPSAYALLPPNNPIAPISDTISFACTVRTQNAVTLS